MEGAGIARALCCVGLAVISTTLALNKSDHQNLLGTSVAASPPASGSIVITANGTRVFTVNPDSGSVSVLDTRTDEKLGEVFVGDGPRVLALSPAGDRLYVTSQGSSTLTVLDTADLSVQATIPMGLEPYGVVAHPGGRLVYVASSAQAEVEVVDVRRKRPRRRCNETIADPLNGEDRCFAGDEEFGPGRVVARVPLGPKPKGLALSPDGTRLYVTYFLSGEISVIDTLQQEVLQTISTGADSNMAQKIAIHPTNGRAYLPHIRSNVINRSLLFDNTVFPVVSVIDLFSNQALPAERVDLSLGERSVNLPFDLAFSADGQQLYVVNLGSGDLSVVDLATRRRIADVDVGDGPQGIAVAPDGRKAYVLNSLSDDVSVIDLVALREIKRIPVSTSPLSAEVKRGRIFFFSSRSSQTSKDRWMSCASCHFEGGEQDGRTWFFPDRGLRNTTSLRGSAQTRPLHWSADRDEFQDFEHTLRNLQAGTGLIVGRDPNPPLGPPNAGLSADLDALAAFIETLKPKPSPFTTDAAVIERGRIIFERPDVGCASCHIPPRYTDSTLAASPFIRHDVGTGNSPDEGMGPAFDTPSLRMLWDTAPYLHDGSAPTLRDVLVTRNPNDRHGHTSQLSEAEIRDLIAFLLSL